LADLVSGYSEVTHRSGSELHEFYRNSDPANAWETMEAPSNQTTDMPFTSVYYEPPPDGARYPFNSTVLSTDQVGERLYFEAPQGASIVQIYGTVGPEQGRYEVRLISKVTGVTEEDIQFTPHPYNQTFTGESPVDANLQVKYVGWLDPRINYGIEIELLEEGKRTDIHGASFWTFANSQSGLVVVSLTPSVRLLIDRRPELDDWYPVKSGGGLSGGQIAGIVVSERPLYSSQKLTCQVGSVAGAALIGLAIWFLIRRRK
jgi:hypothetical protein